MRYNRRMLTILFAATWVMGLSVQSLASAKVGPGVAKESVNEFPYVTQLKAASETDQILLVVGDGTGSSQITISYYRKNEEKGFEEIFSVPGYCGFQGITSDKKEGDRKTPSGDYRFTIAFGVYENPGSILNYHKVANTDYWVDDPSSSQYNRLVDTATTPVSWNSAEHLIDIVPQYHYGLALNYNETCEPGKGSAIFLHGCHSWKTWTEGCVAIPEEYMKLLLQNVDADTRIVIAADLDELALLQ